MDLSRGAAAAEEESVKFEMAMSAIKALIGRIDALVVGPGLSRDVTMQSMAVDIIRMARSKDIPIIIDGDGLQIVINTPAVVRNGAGVYITPNINEFRRICTKFMVCEEVKAQLSDLIADIKLTE